MNTDSSWEEWGRTDPYFAVITDPRFRRKSLDDAALQDFFATGKGHVDYVLSTIRQNIDPTFAPRTVVDFGCGVGRLLIPFASIASDIVGLDVSDSMLHEAKRNCDLHNVRNVRLIKSDDSLSNLGGNYDFLHSCIVFQHIPFHRGQIILSNLLRLVRPGGVAAIHLLYSSSRPTAELDGRDEAVDCPDAAKGANPGSDPEMQMNAYNMNRVLLTLQKKGIQKLHVEFTDHGGELGIFLFFKLPDKHDAVCPGEQKPT